MKKLQELEYKQQIARRDERITELEVQIAVLKIGTVEDIRVNTILHETKREMDGIKSNRG